ncbi:MAG: PAS domain S-box protein [Hyphomicrobiales bacterium]|nr:MAG: PAS domain S-box protein [Hyphomicrobiales bacterium]
MEKSILRTAEERLRVVEELCGAGFWHWERQDGKVTWSSGLYRLLGLDAAAIQPDLLFYESLVHPKDRLALEEQANLASDPHQRDRRFRIIRPDGQLRWLRSRAQTTFDRSGVIVRVVAVVSDVTDQHETQRRAANDRALLHALADLLHVSIWAGDDDGRLLDIISPREAGASARSAAANATWRDTIHPGDREPLARAWREAAARRDRYDFSPRLLMPDGSYRRLHVTGLPFDTASGSDPLWGGISSFHPGPAGKLQLETGDYELLSPTQVRACRALLDWSAETLASQAGISVSTVRRIENAAATRAQADSIRLVTLAFQQGGLAIWRNGDGRFCVSAP